MSTSIIAVELDRELRARGITGGRLNSLTRTLQWRSTRRKVSIDTKVQWIPTDLGCFHWSQVHNGIPHDSRADAIPLRRA